MKLLVIGAGGREHALAWKLAQSPRVREVLVAPGNAGTAREPHCRNVPVATNDLPGLLQLAQREGVHLTVVGPEAPLVAGIVEQFRAAGLRIVGPTAAAAQLEGSKAFAKAFLARHNIPTAAHAVFTEMQPALAHVRHHGAPIVIKADGLAAGKGVVVARTLIEAEMAVRDLLATRGSLIVIEECLSGEEASFIVLANDQSVLPLATSQDHKRVGEGDTGSNTGGMGAYSPAPVVTPAIHTRIMQEIIRPTLAGMLADGMPYSGFLYVGLMIDSTGAPRVIEYNVRLGDPETQPILLRLTSDLLALLDAALDGHLDRVDVRWNPRPALGVVMASRPYPDSPVTGDIIHGLDRVPAGVQVFHAGTACNAHGQTISAGGRVLCVTALGDNVREAMRRAYCGVQAIDWVHAFYRPDIGWRAMEREMAGTSAVSRQIGPA